MALDLPTVNILIERRDDEAGAASIQDSGESITYSVHYEGHAIRWNYQNNLATITLNRDDTGSLNLQTMVYDAKRELAQYSSLNQGWDGYSGKGITEDTTAVGGEIVDFIYQYFLDTSHDLKEITPGPVSDGSIDIEIGYGDKTLILNVSSDGKRLGTYKEDATTEDEDSVDFTWAALEEELSWLRGKVLGQVQLA